MRETETFGTVIVDGERPVREAEFEVMRSPERRREGRPTKLTEARFKRILEHIRRGVTIIGSVRIEGITYQAWRYRLQRNLEWQKQVDEAEEIRETIWRTEALETIRAAFPKSWQAAMTYLERRYPNEFALKVLNRNVNSNEPLFDKLSPEQLADDIRLAKQVEMERPALT